jgi:glycosyltransferase involved in cell wall biosynthesis
MKILIADEGIKHISGHWYAYTDSIRRALIKAGHEVVVAAHVDADEEIVELLKAKRTFRFSRWDGIYQSSFAPIRYFNTFLHNFRMYQDLKRLIKEEGYFDIIFSGNNLVYHVLAWNWITKKYAGKYFGKLTLLFVQDAGIYDPLDKSLRFPFHSVLLKIILRSYRKYIENGSVQLAAETPISAKQYETFTGFPIKLYNHPTEIDFRKCPPEERKKENPICFGCFGFARYEKGSDLLQEAAATFVQQYPEAKVKFMLQWKRNFMLPDGHLYCKNELLAQDDRFQYIEQPLSGDGFSKFLEDTDIMVMPYRWSSYYSRLSRVTIESMIAGIPIIYTKDTWLESAVSTCGIGIGFANESIEDLVTAFKMAYDQFVQLNESAYEQRKLAADFYSGEAFVKILVQNTHAQ